MLVFTVVLEDIHFLNNQSHKEDKNINFSDPYKTVAMPSIFPLALEQFGSATISSLAFRNSDYFYPTNWPIMNFEPLLERFAALAGFFGCDLSEKGVFARTRV